MMEVPRLGADTPNSREAIAKTVSFPVPKL